MNKVKSTCHKPQLAHKPLLDHPRRVQRRRLRRLELGVVQPALGLVLVTGGPLGPLRPLNFGLLNSAADVAVVLLGPILFFVWNGIRFRLPSQGNTNPRIAIKTPLTG